MRINSLVSLLKRPNDSFTVGSTMFLYQVLRRGAAGLLPICILKQKSNVDKEKFAEIYS